jgi:hypothetical protein
VRQPNHGSFFASPCASPHRSSRPIAVHPSILAAPCITFNQVDTPMLFFPVFAKLQPRPGSHSLALPFSVFRSFNPFAFKLLRTLMYNGRPQPFSFQSLAHSFYRHGGVYPPRSARSSSPHPFSLFPEITQILEIRPRLSHCPRFAGHGSRITDHGPRLSGPSPLPLLSVGSILKVIHP